MGIEDLGDEALVELIQSGAKENEALKVLASRHSGIFYRVAHKYFPVGSWENGAISSDREFIFGSNLYLIHESAKKFDKTKKVKFSTYIGNQARYFCLNFINKAKNVTLSQYSGTLDLRNNDENEEDQNEVNSEMAKKILSEIDGMKDERVSTIFQMRYFQSEGKKLTPWAKIHKHIKHLDNPDKHISIQRCIDIHNKAIDQVKKSIARSSKANG